MKLGVYISYTENSSVPRIEEQRNACYKYAAEHGHSILTEYVDCTANGVASSYSAFDRMMRDAQRGKFDGLLVCSLDCFFMDMYELFSIDKRLEKYGVVLLAVTEDYLDPSTLIFERIFQAYAEYFRAEHSRKVKRGIQLAKERRAAQAAAEGKPVA